MPVPERNRRTRTGTKEGEEESIERSSSIYAAEEKASKARIATTIVSAKRRKGGGAIDANQLAILNVSIAQVQQYNRCYDGANGVTHVEEIL